MTRASLLSSPFVLLIRIYQLLISPLLPPSCRYYPSCSAYAVTALQTHGPLKGGYLMLHRLVRCNPWSAGGVDFVPDTWAERGSPELTKPRLGDDEPALAAEDPTDHPRSDIRDGAPPTAKDDLLVSFSDLLYPFEWLVAWIMYLWHELFTMIGLPAGNGWTWTLSIIGLVLVMRAALIPLFVKQIHASRKMQLLQPEMQKIQKKYKGKKDPDSQQKLQQEMMALYKDTGTNPLAPCLPILVQSPFFFGLFRVLNGLSGIAEGKKDAIGPMTRELASQAEKSTIFGAQLSDKFIGAGSLNVQIVTIILIALMSATTFTTQHQLMRRNMPPAALEGPMAQQQKIMLYLFPIIFAVSGVNFPIGVLIYWFTTNVWTMFQQFYVIRRMPAPGSKAEKDMHERRRKAGKPLDTPEEAREREHDAEMAAELEAQGKITTQRVQPKSKKRAKKAGGPKPQGPITEDKPQTDN